MHLKKNVILICLLLLVWIAKSQTLTYGFEWIKSYQPYYKFKITKQGVYQLDSNTLANAGINLSGIHPKRIQLFLNGQEQFVFVQGETDGVFNQQDFIEFYAHPNDGKLDTELYDNPNDQPHPYKSLFTDTAVYFLTILPDTASVFGKRFISTSPSDFANYTVEPYFIHDAIFFRSDEYVDGINLNLNAEKYNSSAYTDGEGWSATKIGLGQNAVYQLATPDQYTFGIAPSIEVKLIGVSDYYLTNPPFNHHVVTSIAPTENPLYTSIDDRQFKGYVSQKFSKTLNSAQLGTATTNIKMEVINDLSVLSDFDALSYIKLSYPRQFKLNNVSEFAFKLSHLQGGLMSHVYFSGFGNSAKTHPMAFDFSSGKLVYGIFDAGGCRFLFDKKTIPSEVYIFDSTDVQPVSAIMPVQFKLIDPTQNYEYIIVTHPLLNNAATQYASYRSSNFKVLTVESQQLYDTYLFGNMSPLVLRRFTKHLLEKQSQKPKYFLLLGKGYQGNVLKTGSSYANNLVPALGVPAADAMITAGIIGSGFESDIPTGRIAAANNEQALNYLQKLIYYETTPDSIQFWRKDVLHISGGLDQNQQNNLKAQINGNGNTIKGNYFGARVLTYNKSNSDPVQVDLKEELQGLINKGISMLTFLGHGSATVLDVNFGSLDETNNPNKYPLFYFNGCNIGNPSDLDPVNKTDIYGRDFICAANKGAIGWLGHSNLTLDGKLFGQMNAVYQSFCKDSYGKGIGDVIHDASKVLSSSSTDLQLQSHCIQLTLQGDPAVKIYSPALPDYKIENNDLFLYPSTVSAKVDSFAIAAIITNQAKAVNDTLDLEVIQTLPGGTKVVVQTKAFKPVFYKDTCWIWLKGNNPKMVGNNVFEVTLNKSNTIPESNTLNNKASLTSYIPGSGVQGLLPSQDAIVTNDTVILFAQNNDLFARGMKYVFELDTSPTFQSPAYQTSGNLMDDAQSSWKVFLNSADTVVYFWRVKLIDPNQPVQVWDEHTFTHIKGGSEGWSQSHFNQIKQASVSDLIFDTTSQQIQFVNNNSAVKVNIARWWHGGYGIQDPYIRNPGVGGHISGGIVAILYDGLSLTQVQAPGIPFTHTVPLYTYYAYDTRTPAGQQQFLALIDSAKQGTYFAMYSYYDCGFYSWTPQMRSAMQQLGSVKVANAQSYYTGFVMVGQKGSSMGDAVEDTVFNDSITSQNSNDPRKIEIVRSLKGKWHTGMMESAWIGPAKAWDKLHFHFHSLENNGLEKNTLSVKAVREDGTDSLLFADALSTQDLSGLNAKRYPYLKLAVQFVDSAGRTPNQFGRWMVTYSTPPEGALNTTLASSFYKTNIQQGDSLSFRYAFQNISHKDFDSLDVWFKITDANRLIPYSSVHKYQPLKGDSILYISKKISTLGLSGANTLSVFVNGVNTQPELSTNNNVITVPFSVGTDQTNPMLDVTFDGVRIMNGDFISPTPKIQITSKDENAFLVQSDTGVFAVYLKRPNQTTYERIGMNSNEIQFTPGTSSNNKAVLSYSPTGLGDGKYSFKVQAKDASGNLSGKNNYEVDFVVENKSTITNFYPYPNPGTTNIRFVFTLTGSKAPDQLLIRISTISGKIIKEITKEEFGPIKIGNNVSEFAWDGTDQFGDRLANGVYLYQVFTKIEGQTIEKRGTAADKFILHNTGKIYLMK